jgi:hypothetical protein
LGGSERDHHLDGLAIIHRTIAIGDAVDVRGAVENEARLDPALQITWNGLAMLLGTLPR